MEETEVYRDRIFSIATGLAVWCYDLGFFGRDRAGWLGVVATSARPVCGDRVFNRRSCVQHSRDRPAALAVVRTIARNAQSARCSVCALCTRPDL